MKFYTLEPEVAGSLGNKTKMDTTVHPPLVFKLHYELDGWTGDDLLESFPCYIVTERLKNQLEKINPSGCSFDKVEVTTSELFTDLYPEREIPKFFWVKIHGNPGSDDLGMSEDHMLVVSERILNILKQFQLENCDIEEYTENSVDLLSA